VVLFIDGDDGGSDSSSFSVCDDGGLTIDDPGAERIGRTKVDPSDDVASLTFHGKRNFQEKTRSLGGQLAAEAALDISPVSRAVDCGLDAFEGVTRCIAFFALFNELKRGVKDSPQLFEFGADPGREFTLSLSA
jgi:hypothetical protein